MCIRDSFQDTVTIEHFKKTVRALAGNQYLDVTDGKSTNVVEWKSTTEEKSKSASLEIKETKEQEKSNQTQNILRQESIGLAIQVIPSDYSSDLRTEAPAPKDIGSLKHSKAITIKPKSFKPPANTTDFWIHLVPSKEKNPLEIIEGLQNLLGNPIIRQMFHDAFHEKVGNDVGEGNEITVYFSVFEKRQDLFTALIVNIMQALKTSKSVSRASLII